MNHPNTVAAGTSGGFAVLVTWLMDELGLHVDQAVGAAIAVATVVTVLFIGRRGIVGIAKLIWRGDPNL